MSLGNPAGPRDVRLLLRSSVDEGTELKELQCHQAQLQSPRHIMPQTCGPAGAPQAL